MSEREEYCYDHPRPSVSVDVVVFSGDGGRVLLILRKAEPYEGMWALPGGFVDPDETVEDAARRELREETSLDGIELSQLAVFSDPHRDPRGRTISVAFTGLAEKTATPEAGDDAAGLEWFALNELPPLAFDHAEIVAMAIERRR